MKTGVIEKTLITSLSLLILSTPSQAKAQLVPRPWVSIGVKDGDATFSVGARALNFGVELGRGSDEATGVDILKFISLPIISPYVGIGLYSADKGVAVSGGVQVSASDNLFLGVGYNGRSRSERASWTEILV